MNFKNIARACATAAVAGVLAFALTGCGAGEPKQVAVPSDATNEARALLLLQEEGLIELSEGVGLNATTNDIIDNPYNLEIVEAEAASLPRMLEDVDMAVINGNYAISASIDPATAVASEDSSSEAADEFGNIIAVRNGEEDSAKTQALIAALSSQTVKDYIEATYAGAVVNTFDAVEEIPEATGDATITVGASPAPHAEILNQVADLLAEKGWTLEVVEYTDYVQPNVALSEGDLDANYFQHQPYLDDYNAENGTDLVGAAKIHFEPLCMYAGKTASIEDLK